MPFKEFCHNKLHTDWLNKSKENYSGNPNSLIRRPLATVKRHFAEISNVDVSTLKKAKFCEFCVNELSSYCTRGNEHDYCDSERPSSRRGNKNEYSKEPMERAHNKVDQTDNLNLFKEQLFESDLLQQLNETDRSRLAYKLGSFEAKAVQLNGIENLYKDMSFMQQFKLDEYLTKFNPVLFAFIDGFTSKSSVKNKDYLVAKTLEMIYCVIFVNIVLPVCFLQNLLLYVASGSRNAVNLTGKGGPHGSYPTVREWISNQTSKPLQFPDGDCVVIFDNNQVIGRSWNIKVNHKTKSSVVTTICQLQCDGYHNIQRQPQLKPYLWLRNIDFIRDNVRIIPQNLLDVHYRMLYFTVAERLKKIISEQRQGTDCNISDDIDDTVAMQKESEEVKVCAKCGHNNPKTKRVCLNCKTNLKQAQLSATQADVYGTFTYAENKGTASNYHNEVRLDIARTDENVYRIQSFQEKAPKLIHGLRSEHRSQPPTLSISDPAFMNPNSIESVKLILRQIGLNAGIRQYGKGNREWLFVVCDGLPFGLCNKVIERTLRCGLCKCSDASYTSETEFQAHHNSIHTGKDEIKVKEFDWVFLRPGNGHYEMNMFKSFIEVNWDVFFGELAKLMGFKSENAQRAAKNGTDNHKTWSLLKIAHQSLLDELLVPYVRVSMEKKVPPTPQGFFKYSMAEATNPNFVHTSTMILTYLQAILNLRAGLRSGNIDAIVSAKAVFAPLFHARNHPKYQEIEIMESIQRQCVPDELKEFYHETESVSLSGNHLNGEGLDFKAEVVNKKVQAWMPRGVPTGEDWLRVTRNLDVFEQLQQNLEEMMGSSESSDVPSTRQGM